MTSFCWLTGMLGKIALLIAVCRALSPIEIKGTKLYQYGNQFFIKGIAYQLSPSDSLLDADVCEKNFALMARAGANVIRTYHVDPWQDHTACMTILANYGIYLIVDIDTFNTTIVQSDPTWNFYQLRSYEHVIAAFAQYDNVLGFFAGNEIVNEPDGTVASPYVKASVRDAKQFIQSQGYRTIPVGYSAADIAEIRPAFQNYLVCEDGATNYAASAIDFFGLNIYEWCGTSTYQESGYLDRTMEMEDYPVPSFFSEFGCNAVLPRQFQDIPTLYGPNMSQVWSGGIVYEWLQEANNYGLVDIDSAGNPTPLADYNVVSSLWAQVDPTSTPIGSYTSTNTAPSCPTNSGGFSVVSTPLPPTPTDDGTADWELQNVALVTSSTPATTVVPKVSSSSRTTTSPTASSTSSARALAAQASVTSSTETASPSTTSTTSSRTSTSASKTTTSGSQSTTSGSQTTSSISTASSTDATPSSSTSHQVIGLSLFSMVLALLPGVLSLL